MHYRWIGHLDFGRPSMRRESSLLSSKLPHCALMELRTRGSAIFGQTWAGTCPVTIWRVFFVGASWIFTKIVPRSCLITLGPLDLGGHQWLWGRNCLLAHRVRLFLSRLVKVVLSSTGNNCDGRIAGCWTCFVGSVPKLPHDGFSHLFTKFQGMQSTNRHTDEA